VTGNHSRFVACPKGDARNVAHIILFDADAMLQREELNSILDKLKVANIPNFNLVAYIHKMKKKRARNLELYRCHMTAWNAIQTISALKGYYSTTRIIYINVGNNIFNTPSHSHLTIFYSKFPGVFEEYIQK